VDDREIADHADLHVMGFQVLDRDGLRRLLQEARAIDQRFVGIGAIEIRRQDLVEALDVGILHRGDIVAVQHGQFVDVLCHWTFSGLLD
jgi:hypothetical protein